MKKINLLIPLFTSALLLTACGGDSVISSTEEDLLNKTETVTSLSDTEVEGLLFMREEEELARDLYLDIYAAKENSNNLTTFKNISDNAEKQHAEAIRLLLVKYGIDDPSTGVHNTYADDELQHLYDQLFGDAIGSDDVAALNVGALVEETDISDINFHKDNVSPEHTDIIDTYNNLLCGSRNHLRAFAEKIESLTGVTYVTQVPALDAEVQVILSTSKESCEN